MADDHAQDDRGGSLGSRARRNDETLHVLLTFVLMSPIVFAWAYVRPDAPTPPEVVVMLVAGSVLTLIAYWVAGRVLRIARQGRRR